MPKKNSSSEHAYSKGKRRLANRSSLITPSRRPEYLKRKKKTSFEVNRALCWLMQYKLEQKKQSYTQEELDIVDALMKDKRVAIPLPDEDDSMQEETSDEDESPDYSDSAGNASYPFRSQKNRTKRNEHRTEDSHLQKWTSMDFETRKNMLKKFTEKIRKDNFTEGTQSVLYDLFLTFLEQHNIAKLSYDTFRIRMRDFYTSGECALSQKYKSVDGMRQSVWYFDDAENTAPDQNAESGPDTGSVASEHAGKDLFVQKYEDSDQETVILDKQDAQDAQEDALRSPLM